MTEAQGNRIDSITAFISIDKGDDNEGIVGIRLGDSWMPLVGADKERIESLLPVAQKVAQATVQKIIMVRFSVRTELLEIDTNGETHGIGEPTAEV